MSLRSPVMFAAAFLALAAAYVVWFNIVIRTDPVAAMSRFETLSEAGAPGRAAPHGERVLRMLRKEGASDETLAPLLAAVGEAQIGARRHERGAALLDEALSSDWARRLDERRRVELLSLLADARILSGDLAEGVAIYAQFLELSGDDAARAEPEDSESLGAFYAARVDAAANLFAEALKPTSGAEPFPGDRESQLLTARQLAALGAFYAMRERGRYAAAGLLSSAYGIRKTHLGADSQATVQIALMLGPVYSSMGRLDDAETLYLEALHAQEKVKGSNNPELSLYIKLLAEVYEKQGRATQAQALYEHMRALFRDAFGAQRYAVNRARDRKLDVDRPVSQYFLLEADYAPTDLVAASDFYVPLSKPAAIDEMKLRRAADDGADPREANLPARLAQLLSLCGTETGERLTLRSGYRAWRTQKELYQRIGYKGTVTPPGMSEHQLGLAADIDVNGRLMRVSDASFQCFEENAFRFGFILSYPPGNDYLPTTDSFEPWHWRYVGVSTARLYREAGPINKPQEFLAALPCYQERAAAGAFPIAGEADMCLSAPTVAAVSAPAAESAQPAGESGAPARKLNNGPEGARAR